MGAGNSDSDEEVAAVGVAALEDIEGRISNVPPQLPPVPKRPPLPRTPLPVRRPPPPLPGGTKRPAPPRPAPPRPAPPPPKPKAPKPPAPPAPDSNSRDSGIDFDRIVAAPAPLASAPEIELPLPVAAPAEEKKGIGAGTIAFALIAGAGIVAAAILLPGDADPEPVAETEPQREVAPLRPLPPADTGAVVDAGSPDVQEVAAVTMEAVPDPVSPMVARPSPMGSGMGMQASVMSPSEMTTQTDDERLSEEWAASAMDASPMEPTMVAPMEPEPEEDLPQRPSRDQVQSALAAVRPAVGACLNGGHGRIPVRITIVGSGRVTTAVVQDRYFARPPTGSCIARAVRTARFPRFSDDRLVVLYPFQL